MCVYSLTVQTMTRRHETLSRFVAFMTGM